MDFFSINGKFNRLGTRVYNLMYLNVLFIISCIPVITIFPAMGALFGVGRNWEDTEENGLFNMYRKEFKKNYKESFVMGIPYLIIGGLLFYNLYLINYVDIPFKVLIYITTFSILILYVLSGLHIFPVLVHISSSYKNLFINSLKLGMYKLHWSISCLILLIIWSLLAYQYVFIIFLLFFSVSAEIMYRCARLKIEELEVIEK